MDHIDATTTNGFPLLFGSILTLNGEIATHEFNAIRLAAVDCMVGVIEGFPDDFESSKIDGEEVENRVNTQV